MPLGFPALVDEHTENMPSSDRLSVKDKQMYFEINSDIAMTQVP